MEMALSRYDYTLLTAADGKQALEIALRDKPDLIIMDLRLPDMNGVEVVRKLRQIPDSSRVPIVAVTACAMRGDGAKVIEAGCDAYLAKPINTRRLPKLIAQMLLQRQKYDT